MTPERIAELRPAPCSDECRPEEGVHVFATRAAGLGWAMESEHGGTINNAKAAEQGLPPCCLPTGTKVQVIDERYADPDQDPWSTPGPFDLVWTVRVLSAPEVATCHGPVTLTRPAAVVAAQPLPSIEERPY